MGQLRLAVLGLALVAATPARADPLDRWRPLIAEASARFGVPEHWIARVMRAESAGRTTRGGRPIVSSAGAMGLMQLMPGTWAAMRARLGLGADPHDPRDNILAGTYYLRLMYERFGYPGLFGAYNAGPARYAGHLATGRRLPAETVAYVAQIAGASAARRTRTAMSASAPAALFAIRATEQPAPVSAESEAAAPAPASLFFALRGVPRP